MSRYLLDVNVLIALVDPAHIEHETVHKWFERTGQKAFATCPITENGLLRIVGHPKYPNSPGPPSHLIDALLAIRALPGHAFWTDSISLTDKQWIEPSQLSNHARVTDSYLLALAKANRGKLATLDQKLATATVAHGKSALALI
jgi:uncharacterized protein